MAEDNAPNQDQAALWNDTSGRAWVEMQELLDATLAPLNAPLLEPIVARAEHVLDIGCGAGATTRSLARRVRRAVGVDISAPLLEVARRRAAEEAVASVSFVQGDAQTFAFERGSFDAAISRFGVMFFDDPVAAFLNIRHALRDGGSLAFLAWRSPADNPFMTAAGRAVAPFFPDLPKPVPDSPGQFAFADGARVGRILEASGWQRIEVRPLDISLSIPERHLRDYVTKLGPGGAALRSADEDTRTLAIPAALAAVKPFVHEGAARFTAACWLVTASN